jgi:hypothetical protein
MSQKRPFLERQMIHGCTNVGITPTDEQKFIIIFFYQLSGFSQ